MTVKCWINSLNNAEYCEGDQPNLQFVEVIQRPDWTFDWNGNAWVQNVGRALQAAQPAKDDADLATVKLDPILTTFVAMTPAQVDAWITANVTNLATATNALRILAKLVLVVARKSLR